MISSSDIVECLLVPDLTTPTCQTKKLKSLVKLICEPVAQHSLELLQSRCVHLRGDQLSRCKACALSDIQRLDTELATYLVFTRAYSSVPLLEDVYSRITHNEPILRGVRSLLPTHDRDLVQVHETAIVLPYKEIPAVLFTPCLSTSRCEGSGCTCMTIFVALILLSGFCSS